MLTPVYRIRNLCNDRFAIMPHPKGGDLLEIELEAIKRQGFEAVISMLTLEEQRELDLVKERPVCLSKGLVYLNYPIEDEIARSDKDTQEFIDGLYELQKQKMNILFHCRGGVGRSSMIVALLAARLGVRPKLTFELISKYRGETAPETEIQKQWVFELADTL